jgi:hypothetical protein
LYEPHTVAGAVEDVPIAEHLLRMDGEHHGAPSPSTHRACRRLVRREVDVVAAHLQKAISLYLD